MLNQIKYDKTNKTNDYFVKEYSGTKEKKIVRYKPLNEHIYLLNAKTDFLVIKMPE